MNWNESSGVGPGIVLRRENAVRLIQFSFRRRARKLGTNHLLQEESNANKPTSCFKFGRLRPTNRPADSAVSRERSGCCGPATLAENVDPAASTRHSAPSSIYEQASSKPCQGYRGIFVA